MIQSYDAHVYYPLNSRALAEAMRAQAVAELQGVRVSSLVDRNVGPHPMPMFQLQFLPERLAEIIPWLMKNRRDLAVLVHEVTGDDPRDHTKGALWMGRVLELDMSKLDPSPI